MWITETIGTALRADEANLKEHMKSGGGSSVAARRISHGGRRRPCCWGTIASRKEEGGCARPDGPVQRAACSVSGLRAGYSVTCLERARLGSRLSLESGRAGRGSVSLRARHTDAAVKLTPLCPVHSLHSQSPVVTDISHKAESKE